MDEQIIERTVFLIQTVKRVYETERNEFMHDLAKHEAKKELYKSAYTLESMLREHGITVPRVPLLNKSNK